MLRKMVVLFVVLSMIVSLAACVPAEKEGGEATEKETSAEQEGGKEIQGTVLDKDAKLSIMLGSHPSWPFQEDWKVVQYIKEAMGGQIEYIAIPYEEYSTKVTLAISSQELPDIIYFTGKDTINQYGPEGAFVSLMDNLDKMPNFAKWLDTTPDSEKVVKWRKSGDGNIYSLPSYGTSTMNNRITWLFRDDIFDKNDLTTPNNYDEFFAVCGKLKELYPDSYPWCMRKFDSRRWDITAGQWKQDMSTHAYYDLEAEKWGYGAIEDEYKEMLITFKKFLDAEYLPPDTMTIDTKSWQELISSDRGFITVDYIVRIDSFNLSVREENPEFTLAVMQPPKGNGPAGTRFITRASLENSGHSICNTGNTERMNNAYKYADWFYSDEGFELVNWGKEGETYKTVDGEREFILDEGMAALNAYGIGAPGFLQLCSEAVNEAKYTKENVEQAHIMLKHFREEVNPMQWLAFDEEDNERLAEIMTPLNDYVNQQLANFMLGRRPFSEWDAYVEEVKALNLDEVMSILEKAYNDAMK